MIINLTKARALVKIFNNLPKYYRNGNYFIEQEWLDNFIELVEKHAIKTDKPYGTNSFDATRWYSFKDESILEIGNRRQECYPAVCYEIKQP